jgi:hypothetical protein
LGHIEENTMRNYPDEQHNIGGFIAAGIAIVVLILMGIAYLFGRAIGAV